MATVKSSPVNEAGRKARVWNFLNTGDAFWPIVKWPDYLQDMMLKAHKSNRERFRLMQFLIGNGMDPTRARIWVTVRDVEDGYRLRFEPYDAVAVRDMDGMVVKARDGTLFQYAYYDMTLGRVVPAAPK